MGDDAGIMEFRDDAIRRLTAVFHNRANWRLERTAKDGTKTIERPDGGLTKVSATGERVTPQRPNSIASSIAIGNPADGDLAAEIARGARMTASAGAERGADAAAEAKEGEILEELCLLFGGEVVSAPEP